MIHKPVLLQEVLSFLDPRPSENFIDATLGEGGHAKALLRKTSPDGMLLGIDRDSDQLMRARQELGEFQERLILIDDSFGNIKHIIETRPLLARFSWKAMVMDLGWSSAQLQKSRRGFSFLKEEPLDMRYDSKAPLSAADILNTWSYEKILSVLQEYGQERFSKRIAQAIIEARPDKRFETTVQLVEIIFKATPAWYHRRSIHCATKTFQALRIAVNNELEELKRGLEGGLSILAQEGIIAVISFHSLEDRIVKWFFRQNQTQGRGIILTKKPVVPSKTEVLFNPRGRSAKLRVFQKHEII